MKPGPMRLITVSRMNSMTRTRLHNPAPNRTERWTMRPRLLLALVVLVLPLALVRPAGAAPSTGGTGTFTVTGKPQIVSSHTTHGYTVLVETLPGIVYSGVVACRSVTEYASFMTDPHGAGNWIAMDVSDSC